MIWALSSFCALHRLPFDAALAAQGYPAPVSWDSLAQAGKELGLIGERRSAGLESTLAWQLPVAVLLGHRSADAGNPSGAGASPGATDAPSAGGSPNAGDPPGHTWALLLSASESHVVALEHGSNTPASLTIDELRHRFVGEAFCLSPIAPEASDPDSLHLRSARFGLRWFLPELLKYRSIWRDVLLASLVLQLLALATPLFTQTIIDKVIVHRTESTLIALGVGMGVFLIFTMLLTWVRQHLILHTGRRIDAVLGAQTFDHLLRLPPIYFQHRPTGVIAARLQGIETVREFIASAAVTLALDVPFLLIFVAIMFWYSVTLTLIVLGMLAVITAASLVVAPVFQRLLNEQFRRGAANQAFLTEYVAAMDTVKSLQLEPQLTQRYRNLLSEFLQANIATRQLSNTYNTVANALDQLTTILVLMVGAWIVMTSTALTVGMLVAFQMFSSRISQPVLRMVGLWQQWQQTRLAIARLGDIMNMPTEIYSLAPRRAAVTGPARIQMEMLAFRYADNLPLLFEDFDFTRAARATGGTYGAFRRRQVDARPVAAGISRSNARAHSRGWRRPSASLGERAAFGLRRRAAGDGALLRHDHGEPEARQPLRVVRASRRGVPDG
jgi:subfamily B ATP-binding cassette protein HlyB/CyaB